MFATAAPSGNAGMFAASITEKADMPSSPVTAREQPDGRYRVIIPKLLAGGKAKRKWFSGPDAKKTAEAFAKTVEVSRLERATHFNLWDKNERAEVWTQVSRLPQGVWDVRRAVDLFLQNEICEARTVIEVIQECLDAKKRRGLSAQYRRELRKDLDLFAKTFGQLQIQAITEKQIEGWIHAQSWSSYTKRSKLINVRTLFAFALNRHYVKSNAARIVEDVKTSKRKPRIFTPEEAEKFMRATEQTDPGMIPWVAMVLFGGLRPKEAMRVKKEYVTETVIDLPADDAKNNKRRLIQFSELPNLKAWLDRGGDYEPKNLVRRINDIRIAAGFTGFERVTRKKDGQKKVQGVEWGKNIFRKSFVSYAVEMFGQSKAALLADHSEAVQGNTYRELVTKSDAEKFWGIKPKDL